MAIQFNRSYSLSSILLSFSLLFVLHFSPSFAQCDNQLLTRVTRSLTIPSDCYCAGVTAVPRNVEPPITLLMLSFLVGEGPLLGNLPDPFMLCARIPGGVSTRMSNGACCVSFGPTTVERCFPSNQVFRCEFASIALASSVCPATPSKGDLKSGLPTIPSRPETIPTPPTVVPLPVPTTPEPVPLTSSSLPNDNETIIVRPTIPTPPTLPATTTTTITTTNPAVDEEDAAAQPSLEDIGDSIIP